MALQWKTVLGRLFLGIAVSSFPIPTVLAQRPTAPRLFPEDTLVYFRVDDSRDMQAKMQETTMGRLSADPQIQPIINEFFGSMSSSLEQVQQFLGVSFEEILRIPNGELALAVVPTETDPAICVLVEAKDELPALEILVSKAEEQITRAGAIRSTKKVGEIETVRYGDPNRQDRQFAYFIDSGVMVLCSRNDYLDKLAMSWTGNGTDSAKLADNRKFTTIMAQSVGVDGERPQLSFYIDPMAIVRQATKNSPQAAIISTFIPVLGVDGIQAIGGSMILRPKDFDSINHLHLLLASPRKGFLQVMRPKTGDTEPENWVNEDVATYFTINWDYVGTVNAIERIVNLFNEDGFFEEQVMKRADAFLGFSLRKELIEQINHRVSWIQAFEKPSRINSGSNLLGIHVKDGAKLRSETLPKLFEKLQSVSPMWQTTTIGDSLVYVMEIPVGADFPETMRAPTFCFTVIDNVLLATDSKQTLTDALMTKAGQNALLRDAVEFRVVKDRIKQQLKDRESSIIAYQRPDESLRTFYDLAADPKNKDRLKGLSENNPFFQALYKALDRHRLPPFEVISKYLAPSGSFVTEDETGLHMTSFGMRRE